MIKSRFAEGFFSLLDTGPRWEISFGLIFLLPFENYFIQPAFDTIFDNLLWGKLVSFWALLVLSSTGHL